MGGLRDDLVIHEKALDILIELLKKEQVRTFVSARMCDQCTFFYYDVIGGQKWALIRVCSHGNPDLYVAMAPCLYPTSELYVLVGLEDSKVDTCIMAILLSTPSPISHPTSPCPQHNLEEALGSLSSVKGHQADQLAFICLLIYKLTTLQMLISKTNRFTIDPYLALCNVIGVKSRH